MRLLMFNQGLRLIRYGDTLSEITSVLPGFTYHEEQRKLYVHGKPDTVSFGHEFSEEELNREVAKRVYEIAKQLGWKLFKEA